jgi:hypothetical protein
VSRGIINYFWKAKPATDEPERGRS